MRSCTFCGTPISKDQPDVIACGRKPGELSEFDKGVCLDEHIKRDHLDRPIDDRPDLLPMGRL